jgi:hypothetical protein
MEVMSRANLGIHCHSETVDRTTTDPLKIISFGSSRTLAGVTLTFPPPSRRVLFSFGCEAWLERALGHARLHSHALFPGNFVTQKIVS